MTYLVEPNKLFSIFTISKFEELHNAIFNIAPSMSEYYLNDLITYSESVSLNRHNIEQSINIDNFILHIDYDSNTYIESLKSEDDYETQSLW